MKMMKKSLHLFFRPFSLFPYFVFPSLFFFFSHSREDDDDDDDDDEEDEDEDD